MELCGRLMMPGTFSYIEHAVAGSSMGATFDGRKKRYSYSDGCSPAQGRDTNGPTAMIRSLTSWDQSELLGGMVVNIKFSKENLKGSKATNFVSLLRAFIERGGIEIQVNAVDRKTLKEAQKNPEKYLDLMVRIGGYSDYFTRLSPVLQQEIIDRTQHWLQEETRYMKDNSIRGNIVNVCSEVGFRPAYNAYSISKWGVRGMTTGLAKRIAKYGIVLNGIAPGETATEILRQKEGERHLTNSPRGERAMPSEIAEAIFFLANSRNIIGEILVSDGGNRLN